jgi:hypothetical protein
MVDETAQNNAMRRAIRQHAGSYHLCGAAT